MGQYGDTSHELDNVLLILPIQNDGYGGTHPFFFALDLLEIEEIHGTWGSVLPSGPSDHEADGVGGKRHRQVLTLCSNHVQRQKPDSFYVLKNHQAGSIITTSLRPIPRIMVSKGNHPQMALIQMSEI